MLVTLTLIVMAIVAYSQFREGVFTAMTSLINVILAGLVAFNFWEPLANLLDPQLGGYEDIVVLTAIFCLTLVVLRLITNNLCNMQVQFSPLYQQIGGGVIGALTGYLLSGFLVCALETMPWHENFMDFEPRVSPEVSSMRRLFPPDRVWLALMRHAGAYGFSRHPEREDQASLYDRYITFDREGTFELRYLRFRRFGDTRPTQPYQGEFERELHKK